MTDDDHVDDELYSRLKEYLMMEYGHRNIMPIDADRTVNIESYKVDVRLDVWNGMINACVFLNGEGEYTNFPTDGTGHTLEQLSRYTIVPPGAYVNMDDTFFCPSYGFTFRAEDLDHSDFIIRVLDRLTILAEVNSNFFGRMINSKTSDKGSEFPEESCSNGCMQGPTSDS